VSDKNPKLHFFEPWSNLVKKNLRREIKPAGQGLGESDDWLMVEEKRD
jgi:hypothetical protein